MSGLGYLCVSESKEQSLSSDSGKMQRFWLRKMCIEWVEIQLKNKVLPEALIANRVKVKYNYRVELFVFSCKTGKIIWWMKWLFINAINRMHSLLSVSYTEFYYH